MIGCEPGASRRADDSPVVPSDGDRSVRVFDRIRVEFHVGIGQNARRQAQHGATTWTTGSSVSASNPGLTYTSCSDLD